MIQSQAPGPQWKRKVVHKQTTGTNNPTKAPMTNAFVADRLIRRRSDDYSDYARLTSLVVFDRDTVHARKMVK